MLDLRGASYSGEGSMKWIFLLARGVVGALGEPTNLCNSSHWPVTLSVARMFQRGTDLLPSTGLFSPKDGRGPMSKVGAEVAETLSLLVLR